MVLCVRYAGGQLPEKIYLKGCIHIVPYVLFSQKVNNMSLSPVYLHKDMLYEPFDGSQNEKSLAGLL